MTVEQLVQNLIDKIRVGQLRPDAEVWISDQQGGGGKANSPYSSLGETLDSGDIVPEGDMVMWFENT